MCYLNFALLLWAEKKEDTAKKIENVKLSAFPEEVDKDGLKWYGEYCSNVVLVLIHQTDYLLKRLLEKYKTEFLQDGGIKEQMSAARRQWRDEHGMGIPQWEEREL